MSTAATARVLVVDDQPAVLSLVRTALSRRGYQVETTSSPSRALTLVRGKPAPDLLLSNILMPEMSGPELATQIARDFPSIPVVLMSGGVPEWFRLPQGSAFLRKPFRLSDLFAVVERTLQQAREARTNLRRALAESEALRERSQALQRQTQDQMRALEANIRLAQEGLDRRRRTNE